MRLLIRVASVYVITKLWCGERVFYMTTKKLDLKEGGKCLFHFETNIDSYLQSSATSTDLLSVVCVCVFA